jgi:hypothetical protein
MPSPQAQLQSGFGHGSTAVGRQPAKADTAAKLWTISEELTGVRWPG